MQLFDSRDLCSCNREDPKRETPSSRQRLQYSVVKELSGFRQESRTHNSKRWLKTRALARVSSRHGRGPLFSVSWVMFYSAHVSIRRLLFCDAGDARRAQRDHVLQARRLQRKWGAESDCAAMFAWRGRAASEVLKLGPAGSSGGGEFCLFCHVSTLAEREGRSSTGSCGLLADARKSDVQPPNRTGSAAATG